MVMHSRSLNKLFAGEDDRDYSPENSSDSPPSSIFNDNKATSSSSPKRSRRAIQKRVVSVPIRDVEGSRLKGETNTPPSDSWAWRKYGQKPIKGSPYPRGYYRCSSSKGCPARKQVERSRVDPTMVVVTYSCEHNHSWPASRSNNHNHNHHRNTTTTAAATTPTTTNEVAANDDITTSSDDYQDDKSTILIKAANDDDITTSSGDYHDDKSSILIKSKYEHDESDVKFTSLGDGCLLETDQFGWFSDLESTCSTLLESPLMTGDAYGDADMAMIFSIGKEDESFFADLEELPECSTVFRQRVIEREEEHRRCSLTPWCGTT